MLTYKPIHFLRLVMSIADATDLIDTTINQHNRRVAYIALNIANELGLPIKDKYTVIIAGLLHDIGAFSLKEKLDAFEFDAEGEKLKKHGYLGWLLLKEFKPLKEIATYIKYHHHTWKEIREIGISNKESLFIQIISIADRIDVSINKQEEILGQVKEIYKKIKGRQNYTFMPDLVKIFEGLVPREYFWLDLTSNLNMSVFERDLGSVSIDFTLEDTLDFAKMFSQIIDFRSPYTATHSSGVTACAEKIAELMGFPKSECQMMKISGFLHDLGKLAVPAEILNKPSDLTDGEFKIIRSHTYHTYRILENIPNLETISNWAAFHHETIDGKGYPFHIGGDELSLGSRIMAVADTFTAITEDRPYRKGMIKEDSMSVLNNMVNNKKIDPNVVSFVKKNYESLHLIREKTQRIKAKEYKDFYRNRDLL